MLAPFGDLEGRTSEADHVLTNDTGCGSRHAYGAKAGERTPFRSGCVNVPCD